MPRPDNPQITLLPDADPTKFWTIDDLCQEAGMSRGAVGHWIRKGQLPAVEIQGRLYVRPEEWARSPLRFRKPYRKHVRGWWRHLSVPA